MKNGLSTDDNKYIPHDPEVESALLGSIIFDNRSFTEASMSITADDFYSPVHGKIYSTIEQALQKGEVIDDVVLQSKLQSLNLLDDIGGTEYITKLKSAACHFHMVSGYAKVIKNLSLRRSLSEITDKYNSLSTNKYCDDDSKIMVADMIGELSAVAIDNESSSGFNSTSDIFDSLFSDEGGRVVETGLECIDRFYPIMTQNLTIIAGRPSHGKSTLGVQLCKGMAESGARVDMYSFEMTGQQIAARLVSSQLMQDQKHIPYNNIYRRDLRDEISDEDMLLIKNISDNIVEINWNDASTMSTSDIICNSLYSKNIKDKPDVIIVDYLNKVSKDDMRNSGKRDDQQLGDVVKRLRDFGKNHDCAIIVVVQLSREVERRSEDGRPFLGALKNSGEIEEHADMVLFTYRKSRYLEQKYGNEFDDDELYDEYIDLKTKMEIICAKQRMGETGSRMVNCIIETNYISCADELGI